MRTSSWRTLVALIAVLVLGLVACEADDPLAEDEPAEDAPEAEEPAEDPADEPAEPDEEEPEDAEADPDAETVVVGSADFAEQLILGNMMAQLLEHEGFDVETRLNLGSREVYFPALETGEVDLFAEYTGALTNFLSDEDIAETETEQLVERLREELEGTGVVALEPSEAQNQDALVVTPETAEEYDLETVSDLAPVSGELVAGGPPEETERHVGLPGLEEVYGIEFADFVVLDAGGPQTVAALEGGDIDVGRMFTTQGIIGERGWVVLEEDQPLIPAENLLPVVREEVLTDDLEEPLNELFAAFTVEELTELNRRVEVEEEDPADVAGDWLEENGLLDEGN